MFQLQSIKEQASKLQLENAAAAEKLRAKDAAIAISELALTGLQQNVAAITRQRNGLQAALDEEKIRERTATQKLADLESRTDEQSKALLRAQRQLLLTNLTWAVRAHQLELPIGSLFYDEEGNFLMDMSSRWPKPYADISLALDRLEQENGDDHYYLAGILPRPRQILESNKLRFICDPVDFEGMRNTYRSQIELADQEGRLAVANVDGENRAGTLNMVRGIRVVQLNKSIAQKLGTLYGNCAEKERGFVSDLLRQVPP